MVLKDFECESGHITERTARGEQTRIRCHCGKPAEVVFLPKRRTLAPATVYYENAAGKRLYPGDGRALPRQFTDAGYTRREVSPFERPRFERETREQLNAEAAQRREGERRQYEQDRRSRHDELRHMSNGFDDFHRDIARHAMEQEDREPLKSYDSEFRIG